MVNIKGALSHFHTLIACPAIFFCMLSLYFIPSLVLYGGQSFYTLCVDGGKIVNILVTSSEIGLWLKITLKLFLGCLVAVNMSLSICDDDKVRAKKHPFYKQNI